MSFVGLEIQIATVMFTGLDEDGFPVAQPDATGSDPGVAPADFHHPFGFASRPVDPDVDDNGQLKPGGGCMLFYAVDGEDTHTWLSYDPRYLTLMPRLKKGGSMQYCSWGSFGIYDGDDGTFTQYVPVAKDANGTVTKAHAITVGVDGNGDPVIQHIHADGNGLVLFKKSSVLKNAAGNAYFETNDSGNVINGATRVNGGMVIGNATAAPLVRADLLTAAFEALATAVAAAPITPNDGGAALKAALITAFDTLKAAVVSATTVSAQ